MATPQSKKTKPAKAKAVKKSRKVLEGVIEGVVASTPESIEAEGSDDLLSDIAEPLTGEIVSAEDKEEAMESDPTGIVALRNSGTGLQTRTLLQRYLAEIARHPLLTPEEERDLTARMREQGDLEAARRLVSSNLRLVVKIAMEYRNIQQNLLDLIQEGNYGLMKAVSKFDPSKGAKLSYYASWWIRSYILKYILDNFRLVRVGTTHAQKKLFFHLMREKERLEAQGIDAAPKLLADRLQVREQDVVEMNARLGSFGGETSIDTPLFGKDGGESRGTQGDMIRDVAPSIDDRVESEQLREIVRAHMDEFAKTLKDKELAIFQQRLAAEDPKTLQEVADQFNLTRERARQIEVKVIEKLQAFYKAWIR